jgi:predicted nucleic acid-binding protein
MIVADTEVLIDALHGKEPAASMVKTELGRGQLATTAVSVFELLSGARKAAQRKRVDALLGALTVFPADEAAGRRAAAIRIELEQKGEGLAMADYLIAGVCVSRAATLLTRNRKHFERVPDLVLAALPG